MIHVLFVCLGNICRSPIAEALFRRKVREAGLTDRITADSAGTGRWHVGEAPHPGVRDIMIREGVEYAHRARQVTESDLRMADYIVAMDAGNYEDLIALGADRNRLFRLMEFCPDAGVADVPDPYYTGDFETVFRLVDRATAALLDRIRQDRNL